MRRFLAVFSASLLIVLAGCSKSTEGPSDEAAKAAGLTTDDDKTIYAVGLVLSQNIGPQLAPFNFNAKEQEVFLRGLSDGLNDKPAVKIEEWGPKIQELVTTREQAGLGKAKDEGKAYQEKAAAEQGAMRTQTGLIYRVLTPGTGASPKASDTVTVNYRGTLPDGKEFDSSFKRNEPATFPLGNVIPCWTEGVQMMKVGGKSQLVCPPEIAYGDSSKPGIPGGSTLVFEVELLKIN